MTSSFAGVTAPTQSVERGARRRLDMSDTTRYEAPRRNAVMQAVRLALGITDGLHEVRDWSDVLRAAVAERCAPLAWVRCGAIITATAPDGVSAAFRSHFVANAARICSMLAASRAGAAALEQEGICPVMLKGPPLAARLYGESAARMCSDLDWFVPASSLDTLHRVMTREGWSLIEGEVGGDPCYARHGTRGEIYLEVHSSLLHPRYGYLPLPAPSGRCVAIDGVPILAHDDAFLPGYLSAHLATHQFAPFAWLVDLFELWRSLGERARADARRAAARAGVERYLAWGLRRAMLLRRAAAGNDRAADRLGMGDARRVEAHPMWRHITLAPSVTASVRAARAWLAPAWVRPQHGGWVVTMTRRVVRHWREATHVRRESHEAR